MLIEILEVILKNTFILVLFIKRQHEQDTYTVRYNYLSFFLTQ